MNQVQPQDAAQSFWNTNVNEIRSFLDENYTVDLLGNFGVGIGCKGQMAWGRIGLEKFVCRVIPQVSGSTDRSGDITEIINAAVFDTVAFGNSTIIVNRDGEMRVSTPEHSFASKSVFGDITFMEKFPGGQESKLMDGQLWTREKETDEWKATGAKTFTLFYRHSGLNTSGKSRITPAIREIIRAASRNEVRKEEVAENGSFPQRVLNGVYAELAEHEEELLKIAFGGNKITTIPAGPDGEKVDITQFDAVSFEPHLKLKESLARDCAAAFNIDAAEMGVTTQVPSSAEALYMSKEDLVLEISAFERSITRTLQKFIDYSFEIVNEKTSKLFWAEPATPSQASQADAFVKIAAVIPALKYTRAGLHSAGLSLEVVDELLSEMAAGADLTQLLKSEVENAAQ